MPRLKLSDTERRINLITRAFATGRLEDISVLEWAIELTSDQMAERESLRDLFEYQPQQVRYPYNLAWRCVFEHWERPDVETHREKYEIRKQLKGGGSQREMIRLIVDAVRPWLQIDTSKRLRALSGEAQPARPRHLKHLIYASISSGSRLMPADIRLEENEDRNFLFELATALNAALLAGLNLGHMIGSISKDMDVTNWQVHRAYFVPPDQYPEGGGEPDRHSDGFAPSTKLMFAVMERLSSLDLHAARRVIDNWDREGWMLYRRLWAAAARNPALVDSDEVAAFLIELADREFWWASAYPEFAELRALRWATLSPDDQNRIEQRVLKGEPAKLISSRIEKSDRAGYKDYHIFVELRRIQAVGGNLTDKGQKWLEDFATRSGDLPAIELTHGFNQGVRLIHRVRTVEKTFDAIPTTKLLDELAKSLADTGWDDKSQNASEFIAENASVVLGLLPKAEGAVAAKVWQALGYAYRPENLNTAPDTASQEDKDKIQIALSICVSLVDERATVVSKAVDGLASFMTSWDRLLARREEFQNAWLRLWPFAVEKTNSSKADRSEYSQEAFNSPAGQLALAFVETCPTVKKGDSPLADGYWPQMLQAMGETVGIARLHAQFVLVRELAYFIAAAEQWSKDFLLLPLINALESHETTVLWEAFSMAHLPQKEVVAELAPSLVAAALSDRLSSEVRGDLSERVIWSALTDRAEKAEPAVPIDLIQQMLRLGKDEVRTEAVRAFSQYLAPDDGLTEEESFEIVKTVFLDVWPKELTLSSKTVSERLARLPAEAAPCYVEATEMVLPYLTPFDCWSLYDFGVIDLDEDRSEFKIIDDPKKAAAFLSILDRSVAGDEGAIIPSGLERALFHIKKISPKLEKDVQYQRLLMLSRR
ncbi:hypothetical protein FB593_11821 [Rhizobium sp. SJZ105]|nr:hypothetical protein [Rhizobium sp. SJZ105]TWC77159.1 hypothetical protein FB593_11821 [Rhizobium sp. SJZ105]